MLRKGLVTLIAVMLAIGPLVLIALYYEEAPIIIFPAIVVSAIALSWLAKRLGAFPELEPKYSRETRPQEIWAFYANQFFLMQNRAKAVVGEPWLLRSKILVESCVNKGKQFGTVLEMITYYEGFFDQGGPKWTLRSEAHILRILYDLLYRARTNLQPTELPLVEPEQLMEALRNKYINLYIVRHRPVYHFFIFDDRHVILEEYHLPGHPKAVYFEEDSVYLAQMYNNYFNEILDKEEGRVIDFSQIDEETCKEILEDFSKSTELR